MSENNHSIKISLRNGRLGDLSELQQLFVGTITHVCAKDYSPGQIKAWTSSIKRTQRWLDMLLEQYVLVAEIENKIVGFATLKNGDYIDFFYVDKDFQHRGIARMLYDEIEKQALINGTILLSSDISITARPFFEKNRFIVVKEQHYRREDVILINFKMTKNLV